jgi:hypothetical protein
MSWPEQDSRRDRWRAAIPFAYDLLIVVRRRSDSSPPLLKRQTTDPRDTLKAGDQYSRRDGTQSGSREPGLNRQAHVCPTVAFVEAEFRSCSSDLLTVAGEALLVQIQRRE